jgi:signal peptidase II
LLIVFSVAVIGLITWLLVTDRAGGQLGQWGMALILGGAAGNVLDRIVRHSVTDFIDFYVGSYHWYTFNVADSAIVVGAALVLLELLRDWRHPSQERA